MLIYGHYWLIKLKEKRGRGGEISGEEKIVTLERPISSSSCKITTWLGGEGGKSKSNWCLKKREKKWIVKDTATALQAAHLSSTQEAREKAANRVRSSHAHAVEFAISLGVWIRNRIELRWRWYRRRYLTARLWSESDATWCYVLYTRLNSFCGHGLESLFTFFFFFFHSKVETGPFPDCKMLFQKLK